MANPTSVSANPACLVSSTDEASVSLDADREYVVMHDGQTNDGTASSETIYLSTAASVDADESEGGNKLKLLAGRNAIVGPGAANLYFKLKAGAATAPTFTIIPGPHYLGRH